MQIKILTNVLGTILFNLLLLANLAITTANLEAETFTYFSFVIAASGLGSVIFGAGIPAWMQINLPEVEKTPVLSESVSRASCAIILLQCFAAAAALLGHLYLESAEQSRTVLTIYLLQMAMTICLLADGVAIGSAAIWFLNVRRLIPEVLFSIYLAWTVIMHKEFSKVTEIYVFCWVAAAIGSIPFIVKRIGMKLCFDRCLWSLVWQASAYLQWALVQASTQRGSVLIAASYGSYETVVLFRWAQIIVTTVSHAYNAVAQVAFPLHKAKGVTSRISFMAALNRAELRASSAMLLNIVASVCLTVLYYHAIRITSALEVSAGQSIVFSLFSMATTLYLFKSTEINWRGLRVHYLLSQYVVLISALFALVSLLTYSGLGLKIPNVAYLLGALAIGKAAGYIFLTAQPTGLKRLF